MNGVVTAGIVSIAMLAPGFAQAQDGKQTAGVANSGRWQILGSPEGNARIKTPEGAVLEARKLRIQLPSNAPGDAPAWYTISCQTGGQVSLTREASGGRQVPTTTRGEAIEFNIKTRSIEIVSKSLLPRDLTVLHDLCPIGYHSDRAQLGVRHEDHPSKPAPWTTFRYSAA